MVMSLLPGDKEKVVLRLAGEVLDEDSLRVPKHVGPRELYLDFAEVRLPTAEGLRAVIHLHKEMRDRGGRLVLSNLTDEVHEVFVVTGLVKVLGVRRAISQSPRR
jgi:anti-anti-sigma factor